MMETNARWNFDTDRIGSDRIAIERRGRLEEDIRFLSIDRSAPFGRTRSIRARCNRRRQCVLRTRTRFAWRSACLRCAAQILVGGSHFVHHCVKWIGWRKKSYRTYPLTRYRFHVQPSLCFYLFTYLSIHLFYLFFFLPNVPSHATVSFFFQRTCGSLEIFENSRISRETGERIRVSSKETTSVSRELFHSNQESLSLSFSRRTATLSAEREPQNFPSTFSYHSLNALPPFKSRTVKFSPACSSSFPSFSSLRPRGKWRKTRCDAISLEIDLARWLNTL